MDGIAEGYVIDTDSRRLNVDLIWEFLRTAYWSPAIPRAVVEKAICHSLCFGVYQGTQQVGFGRVVTDYATYGYIADVFILPEHRGRGLSKALMRGIMDHPELQGFRRWQLGTRDAHGLYAGFGFSAPTHPERLMEKADPEVYLRSGA